MSYSFEGNFRTKATAVRAVTNPDRRLPLGIVAVLVEAIEALPADTDDKFVFVKAVGHQCSGTGSYERSNAELLVEPRSFFRES